MQHTRSQCPACSQVFAGTHAFDAHRVGPYTRKQRRRRCLSRREMLLRGLKQNEQGWWMLPDKSKGMDPEQENLPDLEPERIGQ